MCCMGLSYGDDYINNTLNFFSSVKIIHVDVDKRLGDNIEYTTNLHSFLCQYMLL